MSEALLIQVSVFIDKEKDFQALAELGTNESEEVKSKSVHINCYCDVILFVIFSFISERVHSFYWCLQDILFLRSVQLNELKRRILVHCKRAKTEIATHQISTTNSNIKKAITVVSF